MKSSAFGKFPIVSGSLWIPWVGAWILDADLDLSSTDPLPTAQVTPNICDTTLTGTIESTSTFRFGEKAHARTIAGHGAWSNDATPKHFHSDAGLLSSTIITATASEIGETVNVASPVNIGIDYFRLGVDPNTGKGKPAPASRVLEGFDWHIDANGVTQVAPWPTVTPADDVQILNFDAKNRRLDLASTSIVWPGTVFTDSRFGTMIARDVEHTFTSDKFRITAWCAGSPSSRYQTVLRNQIREYAQTDYSKVIQYRITSQGPDNRVQLQAVDPTDGFPSALPLSVWPGMQGDDAQYALGSVCLVEFIDRDPTQPIVRGFQTGATPLQRMIEAIAKITIGSKASNINLGGPSALPLAHADPLLQIFAAIGTEMAADVALLSNPPTSVMFAAYAPAKLALLNTLAAAILAELATIPTLKVDGA